MMLKDFSTDSIGNPLGDAPMVAQRVRIPCPSCSHDLHIRVDYIGKTGECRYCGHRFRVPAGNEARPTSGTGTASFAELAGTPLMGPGGKAEGFGRVVESLERDLQETWALLTARQASVLEHLIVELGGQSLLPQVRELAGAQGLAPLALAPATDPGPGAATSIDPVGVGPLDSPFLAARSLVAPSTAIPRANVVELTGLGFEAAGAVADFWPVAAGRDVIESGPAPLSPDVMERLVRDRAECDRLRDEAHALRSERERLRAEVERLRPAAEKLKRIRAERDRLKAERDMGQRETTRLRDRLAELQLTLVEAEAELDDCRARSRSQWQGRRQGHVDEADRLLVEHEDASQFEFDLGAWSDQVAIASKRLDPGGSDAPRG